jgi:hypothetical protein
MSRRTEIESYDRLQTAIGEAVDACKNLAVRSEYGRSYVSLRDSLHLIEGACRELGHARGDYNWFVWGMAASECHKRAGNWLRGYEEKTPEGPRLVKWEMGKTNQMFIKLGAVLLAMGEKAKEGFTAKTGTTGPILPPSMVTMRETRREGRPALSVPKSKSGLILPPRYAKAG